MLLENYKCKKCKSQIKEESIMTTTTECLFNENLSSNHYCEQNLNLIICSNCNFIEVEEVMNRLSDKNFISNYIYTTKKIGETNLKIFKEIRFNFKYLKWQTVILYSRIIILHIAIDQSKKNDDKKEFKNFKEAVDYLKKQKKFNPKLNDLLDNIRKMGNNINHDYEWFKKEKFLEVWDKAKICYFVIASILNDFYK